MNTMYSISPQKRKRCEYRDPDYPQLDNNLLVLNCKYEIQSSKINILSKNYVEECSAGDRLRKIEAIIDSVYNNEIAVRENQLSLIEDNLMNTRKLLEKLRFNIVSQYYGEQQLRLTLPNEELMCNSILKFDSEDKELQTAMHPAVQKLISKRPRETYKLCKERIAAQNAKTTIRQKMRPIYKDQYKQQFKRLQKVIVEHMGSNQNKNVKRFKTNAYRNIMSAATSNEIGSKMISKTNTGVNIQHKAVTANRLNNKIKCLITIGNTSKYIGKDMKQICNRQGSHIFTHKWLVYVTTKEPNTPLDYYVKRVRFHLHDSYRPNNVVDVGSPPFQLSRFGWGEFPIRIQVHFHSYFHEKPIQFVHYLVLDKSHTGVDTIGAETIAQIWLRNIAQKEHQIQIEKSNIPEYSNNGINCMATTDISTNVLDDALVGNLVESTYVENCSDTQFTQTTQTKSTTCTKQMHTFTLSQQEQRNQLDDNHSETLQNKTNFVNLTDYLQAEHIRTNESITQTSIKTNDNNKSATSETRTVMVAKYNPYENRFVGSDAIQMKTVIPHNIPLENCVKKVECGIVCTAYPGSTLFINTNAASDCQNNARLHTLATKMMTTAAITAAVVTSKIVTSTRQGDYNNSGDFRSSCNCISTQKKQIISLSNANKRYILSSTTAPTISNASHHAAQHSSEIICHKPSVGRASAAVVHLDSFISSIPKTKQAMLITSTSTNVNSDGHNEIDLNTTFSTVPAKSTLLVNKTAVGLKYSNCQMGVNPISMISIRPAVSSINSVSAFVSNAIATNSKEMNLQQQQPKRILNFFQRNMVQYSNSSGNVKFFPMRDVTTSNTIANINCQQYQQFITRKQPNFSEHYKAQITTFSKGSTTMKMGQQGRPGDILIPKINPVMVTVKLPNTLSNRHSNNNITTTTSVPAVETGRSTGIEATTSGKHAINSRDQSIAPDVLIHDPADNFLVVQPNLLTRKINISRITSMKNVIIHKEGKLCIIDPMQTKLKQRLQGKQVSLLKPCISLLNQQLTQKSKQYFLNQVMATNSHRLDQIFLKQHFSTMHSAIDFLLKNIKLIGKSKLLVNMFPFVTQSLSQFQSLNALKQRSREWLRAKAISHLLHKHFGLQQLHRNGKFDFWSVKEIALYARNYAYTPSIKPLNPPKEAYYLIETIKTKHNHYKNNNFAVLVKNELQLSQKVTPIDTTTDQVNIIEWLANVWYKLLIYEQLEDEAHIDIEIDNTINFDTYKNSLTNFSNYSVTKCNPLCSASSKQEHTLRRNNNVLLETPVELQYEYELCSNFLRSLNIQLHPEELCAHVWHSTAHILLAHCLQSFIDKLLRQSIGLKNQELQRQRQHKVGKYNYINTIILNEHVDIGEYTLEVQDIVRVLKKNHAEFDFLTNRNFGCDAINFTYSQNKQESIR